MERYQGAAQERAMKVQEVILRAMSKRITWWQAAEIIGISVNAGEKLDQEAPRARRALAE